MHWIIIIECGFHYLARSESLMLSRVMWTALQAMEKSANVNFRRVLTQKLTILLYALLRNGKHTQKHRYQSSEQIAHYALAFFEKEKCILILHLMLHNHCKLFPFCSYRVNCLPSTLMQRNAMSTKGKTSTISKTIKGTNVVYTVQCIGIHFFLLLFLPHLDCELECFNCDLIAHLSVAMQYEFGIACDLSWFFSFCLDFFSLIVFVSTHIFFPLPLMIKLGKIPQKAAQACLYFPPCVCLCVYKRNSASEFNRFT